MNLLSQVAFRKLCWIWIVFAIPFLTFDETRADDDIDVVLKSTNSVWYDSEKKGIKPIASKSKPLDASDRHASVAKETTPYSWSWLDRFRLGSQDFFSWLFSGWKVILVLSLLAMLCLIIFLIWKYVDFGLGHSSPQRKKSLAQRERETIKIQDLPFELEQSVHGLLGQAERYRASGDYEKAIVYLYSYALVELDGARCVRLAKGKTNRMYLRELKSHVQLRSFTDQLVNAFEHAFFGKHSLSQVSFETIWSQLPGFERDLKMTGAKATDIIEKPLLAGGRA